MRIVFDERFLQWWNGFSGTQQCLLCILVYYLITGLILRTGLFDWFGKKSDGSVDKGDIALLYGASPFFLLLLLFMGCVAVLTFGKIRMWEK